MSAHRCFVEQSKWNTAKIELTPDETHYLLHVLRVNNNSKIKLFDGKGREAEGRVVIHGKKVWIADPSIVRVEQPPKVKLCLTIAVLKSNRMDFVIEKATELGVSTIIPFVSEHTIKRPVNAQSITERWRKIALNATRQCNSVWLPEIYSIADYGNAVNYCKASSLFIVATLVYPGRSLYEIINQYKNRNDINKHISLMIGPEGDFTSEEVTLVLNNGAIPVSLGKRVLRAETAALYGLSIIQYELR